MAVRDTVLKSLRAISSSHDAGFYAKVFQQQEPERFALIVVDPRCLKNPLLESFISDLKILSNLDLTPVLLVGALDEDVTSVSFQSQRLCKALDGANIQNSKLNCASYEFMNGVRTITKSGRFAVLEMMGGNQGGSKNLNLQSLVMDLQPFKVIFLQPSGGFRVDGQRVPVMNIDDMDRLIDKINLSVGQKKFVDVVKILASDARHHCTYVIASPLNLLTELFTVKGAGTLLRRGAKVVNHSNYDAVDKTKLRNSIETTFHKKLAMDFFERPMMNLYIDEEYRGGAIVMNVNGNAYLSKFWVTKEAQGEGIARDIWKEIEKNTPKFYWRSKKTNPFNNWYMKICQGMQVSGAWRVFWSGFDAAEIPDAIHTASLAPIDFEQE